MRRRVMVATVLGVLFAMGWWAGGSRASRDLYAGLDLFVEVLESVQDNYVDAVETSKLVTGAMRGVAHGLDPWSRYLDAEEFRAARGSIQGTFDGIGASVDQRDGWPVVVAPVEGSPAWEAGLRPGDLIMRVDGRGTYGLSPDEVAARLRGEAGTKVTLDLMRGDDELELVLERRRVQVRNVPYAFAVEPGVGYLRLSQFSIGAAREVASALDTLRAAGARAVVLDLRGNPGGTMDEAVAIAGLFLPNGAEVMRTEGRATGVSRDYRVESARPAFSGPLAVLVDRGSASASEILAGALQDHDRGVLVGDTTYGKGVAQQIYPLRGSQGAVQITVSRYRTPSGRTLHRERTAATFDPESDEDAEDEVAPAPEVRDTARTWRTAAGRVVRGGRGLEPEAAVVADSSALRLRTDSRHPGGPAGAARAALAVDPVFQRALAIVRGAADTRAVFAAAGAPLPGAPPKRR